MNENQDTTTANTETVSSLGRISRLLLKSEMNDESIRPVLEVIGETVGIKTISLQRKQYKDGGGFELDCFSTWSKEKSSSHDVLQPEDIPTVCWSRMDAGGMDIVEAAEHSKPGTANGFLLVPLFLDEQTFGFLMLQDITKEKLPQETYNFLKSVAGIFELWLSRMNVKKRLEDLIEFLPNATIGIDTNGVATVWNPAVEEMTGWGAERIVGKDNYEYALPFYDMRRPLICDLILHPDSRWEATYPEFRKEGDVVHSLIFTPALTGGGAFLTGSTKRFRDLNESVYGSLHIVRDITRERRSESMFRTITDYAGLGIALFSKEKALYYNERFEDLLGISGREISIQDLTNAVHSEDRDAIRFNLDKMFSGTERGPLRLDLRAKIGDSPKHFSSYAQMLDYEGKPTIYFVLDDTSEQKELAQKARLNELKLYHEGRLTALGIMAAGIAHELNQPLNTIRVINDGFLFGRDEGWDLDPDELYDGLEMIARQVMRMTEVIQNIRNFSREDRDQPLNEVHVNEAIVNVFSMIGRQLEAHNIVVHKDLGSDISNIRSHINRLEQVIMNLVVNARQALDSSDHSQKRIWIKTGSKDGMVFIEVGDNATGIPEGLMAKIFDPFFTTKEVGQGTGLGLTISQSIISEFKGQLEVFNNKNGGATFIVTLPSIGG